MPSKWNRFQDAVDRAHQDLFFASEYTATFYNRDSGSYDPDEGTMTGQSRSVIAEVDVEYVPPGMDTTVDVDGTNFDWTTSIRFPQSQDTLVVRADQTIPSGVSEIFDSVTVDSGETLTVNGTLYTPSLTINGTVNNQNNIVVTNTTLIKALTPLGVDNERPTEVELSDPNESDATIYELHGYSLEQGSAMVMCRLVEQ